MKYYNSQIEFVQNEQEFLSSTKEETVIVTLEKTEAIYGKDDSCNTEWCKENNIPFIHQSKLNGGGCIIGVKGNIFLDIKRLNKGGECLSDKFSKALAQYFISKGFNSARCNNNDVLIDTYKVASGCECMEGNFLYMGYQISIYQDIEIIKHACNKPMIKIPKALSEYGITTEEMLSFCESYWKQN